MTVDHFRISIRLRLFAHNKPFELTSTAPNRGFTCYLFIFFHIFSIESTLYVNLITLIHLYQFLNGAE